MNSTDVTTRHLREVLQRMPPVQAMAIDVRALSETRLELQAPLSRNVNDKACAFGGSLASILTLAAWGALEAALHRRGVHAELYIAESSLTYLAPLYSELRASAVLPDAAQVDALLVKLAERGRGGLWLDAEAHAEDGTVVARLRGRYAAKRPNPDLTSP